MKNIKCSKCGGKHHAKELCRKCYDAERDIKAKRDYLQVITEEKRGYFYVYRGNGYGPFNSREESREKLIQRFSEDEWGKKHLVYIIGVVYFGSATIKNKYLENLDFSQEEWVTVESLKKETEDKIIEVKKSKVYKETKAISRIFRKIKELSKKYLVKKEKHE